MKITLKQSIKLLLMLTLGINSKLLSQDPEEQIVNLLHQNYSSNFLLASPLCEIDRIKDYYLEYGTDNTLEQLAGCTIFFAWDSVTDKSNIGIYSDDSILWLSEALDFYRGGIAALKDINKDNKIEIVTVWASNRWDQVWIFKWNDSTGVILNEIESGYSNISGHTGTIVLEDIDGDGIDEFLSSQYYKDFDPETDTEIEVEYKYVYKWNGTLYESWEDTSDNTE